MAGYAGTAYAAAPYAAGRAVETGPPPEPVATLSGTTPGVTGSLAANAVALPVDGTFAGTAPGVVGSLLASLPDAVTAALAGQAPAVFGDFAGSYAALVVVVGTDATYANEGYNYTGVGSVDYTPPIAPTPARVRRLKVQHIHQSLPAPTLENGRPV